MHRRLSVLAITAVMALSIAAPAAAITNGQPDGDDHPYVGLLVFDAIDPKTGEPAPAWRCSGALIAPTVVLTAGHCTDGAVAARVWFDEDVTYDAVPYPLYPYGGPGSGAVEGTAYTHPDYRSPDNPYGGGNGLPAFSYRDIGLVVLNRAVDMDEHAALPTAGLVGELKPKAKIDFVGYGVQSQAQVPGNMVPQPPPYNRWEGLRVRMHAPSELVSGKFVHSAEYMKLALNPGGGSGGTCFGDSGGPDLVRNDNTVLAVNSYVTNVNCGGVGYASRVDIPEVLGWINGFLDDEPLSRDVEAPILRLTGPGSSPGRVTVCRGSWPIRRTARDEARQRPRMLPRWKRTRPPMEFRGQPGRVNAQRAATALEYAGVSRIEWQEGHGLPGSVERAMPGARVAQLAGVCSRHDR